MEQENFLHLLQCLSIIGLIFFYTSLIFSKKFVKYCKDICSRESLTSLNINRGDDIPKIYLQPKVESGVFEDTLAFFKNFPDDTGILEIIRQDIGSHKPK